MTSRSSPGATLVECLRSPTRLRALDEADWDRLIPHARATATLARLATQARATGLLEIVPPAPRRHLEGARRIAEENARMIRWELDRIGHALNGIEGPVVLLKGAAYVAAELRLATGRLTSDVDLLVPRAQIGEAEERLIVAGWVSTVVDDYDDHFYREWSHELPPLQHAVRGTVADVHHTIVPLTSRLVPSAAALIAAARPLNGAARFSVLAPEDMLLHSAVHGFHDGELANALRDTLDVADLAREFSADPAFWASLTGRAEELGLSRPLFHALRAARDHLALDLPPSVTRVLERHGPSGLGGALMRWCVDRAVVPDPSDGPRTALAHQLLYLRSHWLRMPPGLLAYHLSRKALRRLTPTLRTKAEEMNSRH